MMTFPFQPPKKGKNDRFGGVFGFGFEWIWFDLVVGLDSFGLFLGRHCGGNVDLVQISSSHCHRSSVVQIQCRSGMVFIGL